MLAWRSAVAQLTAQAYNPYDNAIFVVTVNGAFHALHALTGETLLSAPMRHDPLMRDLRDPQGRTDTVSRFSRVSLCHVTHSLSSAPPDVHG